jgi:DNA-binding NarL/FixJ family response regulator
MPVRVAVKDPLPVFRRGVVATLSRAGFTADEPEDLVAWVDTQPRTIVVLTVLDADDWDLLEELSQARHRVLVLAVLEDTSTETYVRALTAGAVSAMPRDATPALVLDTFCAAIRGTSLVPVEVIRSLLPPSAAGPLPAEDRPGADPPSLSGTERRWLRELSTGMTVGRLAQQEHYSERVMFRLLRELYDRLGVRNRTEALMYAQERGLL